MSSSKLLQGLGQLARQAMTESSKACGSQSGAMRSINSASGRYTPNQFSKDRPMDKAAHWVPKNPFIESWAYRRDKFEREFSWSMRNAFELCYFVGGISVGFYALGVWTVRNADTRNGYPERDFLWANSKTGFRLPDEREWY
mmetsp:Transcript_1302/g.2094  ORF Transcript_1302/g.2094 Transcript_1302/m.2094 type:complete len:142 (+) Transcript_1302:41-466(+)|eukprot:CAMPEP_0119109182 /NCGR_PEP_ID=MMETSP1180-20130426/17542_1 /TAXON_ID=3052 ORGANISM="Chlamydomonas cf sp, Strain CCMP681" /NCGR_SAMPLE_ID=MMETSP1180 /ASSEMBLY_ACC=CAM_ASM_000741 /LENGTH=141 /DNA_ID=CAMNT_0007094905 /DNA_START=38 /DNA_END=463 /DNA_ORIENTATION=-